jgi:hypothetical protein
VGDALHCPDSESAYALLESFMVLYEYTRENRWLRMAEKTAVQFSSWICGYNYQFPEDSLLGRLDIKTKGCVFANVQNKHGSPGICTHSGVALFRLFRATREIFYIRLLRDIIRFIPQMMSHPSRLIKGMDIGWITERVNTTDWLEGIGEIMYGSTWSETSLMLAYTEIPGLYVQPDESFVFPFDFVDYEILHDDEKELVLRVINPSEERIRLRVFSENSEDLGSPFGENTLFGKTAESIEPGGSVRISFQKH